MKINDLVDEFERLGIQLWSDDGQLRYRAPQGALTDERKQILVQNKAGLLSYLGAGSARLVPDPGNRFEPFPLTQMQAAYQLGQRQAFDFGGVACTAYMELVYPGDVSAEVGRAWNQLVARHDMLRAVVDDGSQRVLPAVETYRVAVEHFPGTGSTLPRARMDAVREQMQAVARDGSSWPLFDVRATVTDESTVVHLLVELVVVDAASVQILLGELDAALSGDPLLPPPTVTFRDYVVAERTLRAGPGFHRDRAYWTDRLEQLPPAPELPVLLEPDGPARFRRLSRRLDAPTWEGLRRRSKEHRVTSSTTVLTAFAETLGRWARRREFTVNVPVFNRLPLHEQIGEVVGDFTSVSLLGVSLDSAGESFAERAGAIGDQLYADLDHRLFSGLDVITELTRRRKHPPLFPVVFTSTLGSAPGAASSRGRFHDGLTQTPQVWVDCQVMADADGGLLSWDVREGVLPDGLAEAAFEAFADLVGRLATGPDAWGEQYPVRLPESQRRCRAQVNDTAAPLPQHTLHGPVLDRAVEAPHRPAVVDGAASLTYGELAARAGAVARALDEAGCRPGDRVAVSMVKGADQVVALLGAHLAGTAYVPVDPGQPTARRDKVLAGADIRAVLVQSWSGTGDTLPEHLPRVEVDRVAASPDQRPTPVEISPDDPAYVIYTSGSTGEPKGVEVTHRAAANTIDDISTRFGVEADDTVLSIVNLGFDLSVYDVFGVLAVGGTVVLPSPDRRADPSHWADLVRRHQVTVWNTVPSQMQMLQDYVDSTGAGGLGSLRLVLLSGDWIPLDLPGRVQANHPAAQVVSLGGATEAAIWSIWHPVEGVRPGWRSIPYGTPLKNQSFRILDGTRCDRPDWVPGELYIGGAGLASRYVGDPHKTEERFVTVDGERLYRTGDLARYWPDGTIEFLGREDDQVKIRGHRVELGEIEAALRDDPAVADAAVVADGERTERRLTGFVELAQVAPTDKTGQGEASPGCPGAVRAAASAACSALAESTDTEASQAFVRRIDALAVQSMITRLRSDGLFADPEQGHTEHEVAQAVRVDGRRRRLLRRWLDALEAAEVLTFDSTTRRYRLAGDALDRPAPSWDAETVERGTSYGAGMVDFLRACTSGLGGLLRGETDVRDLLFPEGGFGAARAVYEDNHVVRSLNSIAAAVVREIAEQHSAHRPGQPLRVVEVGAGAGGATAAVVEAVGALAPDYLFTDVSAFFLTEARRTFAAHPWMRLGLLDINADLWSQGYAPNSADVVLCANSLHNAHDVGQALDQIRSLVAPGGWLVLVEPVRRHSYSQLVSTEFELGDEDFVDERASTGQAFFARDQWLDLLAASGATDVHCVPEESSPLDYGQAVVLARLKADTAFTTGGQVQENLAGRVPDYMVPPTLHLVDALPRSTNGKLDRATLVAWAGRDGQGTSETSEASAITDELETRVAEVWEDILGTAVTRSDQDFYSLGGDSLLLSRMVGRLRERLPEAARWEWAVLLRRMLQDPTVRGLAHHLRTSPAPQASCAPRDGSCVVDLGSAAGADAPVRVLVHGGTGTLQPYQAVIPLLRERSDYRLLGVETTDVDRYLDLPAEVLISELAGGYARELVEHGDRFAVAGYCLGGFVAAEVARALTEAGATVDRLTIISSYQPPAVEDELMTEYLFALLMRADTRSLGLPDDDTFGRAVHDVLERTPGRVPPDSLVSLDGEHDAVGAAFRAFGQAPRADRLAAVHRAAGGAGTNNAGNLPLGTFVRSFDVFCHSTLAVARHRPEPYVGPVSLMRNSGSSTLLPGTRSDVGELWGRICLGELVVDDLPGDHFTCMASTNAALITELLQGPPA